MRVVVEVMPKPEILDPQGKAVRGALVRLGFDAVRDVRQGKRFEIDVPGPVDDALLEQVHEMAGTLLANPVIEDFTVHTEADDTPADLTDTDEPGTAPGQTERST